MKKDPFVTKRVVNVGVAALARECHISKAAISKRLSAGESPDQIRARAALRQGRSPSKRRDHGRLQLPNEYEMVIKGRERADAMEQMKFRRAKALAERQEIENMLRRGELMPIRYARLWGMRFLIDGRNELLKGPSELADSLAAEADPLKVAAILRAWLERAMDKFEQLRMLWEDKQSGSLEENRRVKFSSNEQLTVVSAEARS
jgi:hypothetical protein